jgi:hypothetical protein
MKMKTSFFLLGQDLIYFVFSTKFNGVLFASLLIYLSPAISYFAFHRPVALLQNIKRGVFVNKRFGVRQRAIN